MRVTHVISTLEIGGAERLLVELVQRQMQAGTEVAVVVLSHGGQLRPHLERLGANVISFETRRGSQWLRWAEARRAIAATRRLRSDVVHTWMYHAGLIGVLAARRGTRTVVSVHHNDPRDPSMSRATRTVAGCLRRLLWRADVAVYPTEKARRVHERAGWRPAAHAIVAPGADADRFLIPDSDKRAQARRELGLDPDDVVIVAVARYHPDKDPETLIAGFAQAFDVLPRLRLVLVGRGMEPANRELSIQLERERVQDVVLLQGDQLRPERALESGDIFCLASRSESFGIALVEGMLCGLTPVVTNVGAAEVISGGFGALVEPKDPAALGRALVDAARASVGASTRHRIRAHAMRFDLSAMSDAIRSIYIGEGSAEAREPDA